MEQIEVVKNCILLNLHLAQKSINEKELNLTIHRIQDARHSLEELELLIKKTINKNDNQQST